MLNSAVPGTRSGQASPARVGYPSFGHSAPPLAASTFGRPRAQSAGRVSSSTRLHTGLPPSSWTPQQPQPLAVPVAVEAQPAKPLQQPRAQPLPHRGSAGAGGHAAGGLGSVSAALEEAEEARSLRQARIAAKIKAQVHHSGCGDAGGGASSEGARRRTTMRRSSTGQVPRWWSSEPNPLGRPTPEAMLSTVCALCSDPGALLPAAFVGQVLEEAEELLRRSRHAAVAQVPMPAQEQGGAPPKVIVVGDTHGQLEDVLWIFRKHGLPSRSLVYLFNGDIADRGTRALEIFVLVFGFMITCPGSVYLNRGNHEDEAINQSGCGGFYNECLAKYGRATGGQLYDQMRSIYPLLPLASILKDSVFIVHGGLSRCSHFLQLLECLPERASTLPVEPHGSHELAMVDALWADPSERPGLSPSLRGGNLICFGPDVTHSFLQETGLSLVVRSHEVPKSNDGICVAHGSRLVTVFSASNYCGTTGNQGAVLVFHEARGKLGFDVSRHFAPTFESGSFRAYGEVLASGGGAARAELMEAAQRAETYAAQQMVQRDPSSARLQRDVLRQVAQLVVEHKPALWAFFFRHDRDKSGFIDVRTWQIGCAAVLGDLPWTQLQPLLVPVEDAAGLARLDYVAFVQRFRVGIKGDEVSDSWADNLITNVFLRLMHSDWTLSQLLDFFDQDRNGTVTLPELREALMDLDIGITEHQAAALMRTISAHASKDSRDPAGGIDVLSFLTRFELAFQPLAARRNVPAWVTGALRSLGREIWTSSPAQGSSTGLGREARAAEFFEAADSDGDGLLSPAELVAALRRTSVASQLSDPELRELAMWIDVSGEGQINYLEFLSGFTPGDAMAGQTLQLDIMESVCTAVWANQPALLGGCLYFDAEHSGKVSREELVAALRALNAASDVARPLLTEDQITVLLDHTRFHPKTGQIRYRRFLDSFRIFDMAQQDEGSGPGGVVVA